MGGWVENALTTLLLRRNSTNNAIKDYDLYYILVVVFKRLESNFLYWEFDIKNVHS